MESATISHNNVNLTVKEDSETSKLINDTSNVSQYTSEVSKALLTNENTEEKQAESNFKWTQNLIILLIDIRKREGPKFNDSNTEEKQLWQNIADEINNIINVGVTGDMCDVKYRELLATYKANKEKQNCTRKNSRDSTLEECYLGPSDWAPILGRDYGINYAASSALSVSMFGCSLEELEGHLLTTFVDLLGCCIGKLVGNVCTFLCECFGDCFGECFGECLGECCGSICNSL